MELKYRNQGTKIDHNLEKNSFDTKVIRPIDALEPNSSSNSTESLVNLDQTTQSLDISQKSPRESKHVCTGKFLSQKL